MIRGAEKCELDDILRLIAVCVEDMQRRGIEQWDKNYPNVGILEMDLQSRDGYVYTEDNKIVGYFAMDGSLSPEYEAVTWQTDGTKPFCIHRLCVHPDSRGRGIASEIMDYYERCAAETGCTCLRLDTGVTNDATNRMYTRRGYTIAGQVHFEPPEWLFNCYEKAVDKPTGSTE